MAIISITPLDPVSIKKIAGIIALERAACYHIAFQTVVQHQMFDRYVLGIAGNRADMQLTPHCWVKTGDQYHDPLLQSLDLVSGTIYNTQHELTREEVLSYIEGHYGPEMMVGINGGQVAFFPPALNLKGEIIFE